MPEHLQAQWLPKARGEICEVWMWYKAKDWSFNDSKQMILKTIDHIIFSLCTLLDTLSVHIVMLLPLCLPSLYTGPAKGV